MMKKIAGGILIFLFLLYPFSPLQWIRNNAKGYQTITADTVWSGEIEISENYSINSSAKLTIEKGSKINFSGNFLFLYVYGILDIRGTMDEPVIISGPGGDKSFSISVERGGYAKINNAEIYGGGNGIFMMENNSFISKSIASGRSGALTFDDGKLEVQDVDFHDNYVGIKVNKRTSSALRVNRSSFKDNSWHVECTYASDCKYDFRNNWWGSADGPQLTGYDQDWNRYEKIYGNINVSPFRGKKEFRDPVILIPGITGSWEKDGQWELDPILRTYDNLYESLIVNGYVEGYTLFTFPYQWRDSNIANAELLRDKIIEIKQQNDWPKVDVVAHSMGGLLAREYIQSDYYQDDVDQLITLGTPQLGAPDAYPKWEAGSWSLGFTNLVIESIFKQEAEKAGYENIFDYIHGRPMLSVQELLPIYDYLFDEDKDAMRTYPADYPENQFLYNLNQAAKLESLKKVEFSKIIGEVGDPESTVAGFEVFNEDLGKYWEHGYPNGFELFGNQGMIRSDGDGTVPIFSAKSENIYSDYLLSLNSSHSALPTVAQGEIFKILTGKLIGEKVERNLIEKMLIFTVFSPVDIQVIDPEGNFIGKNLNGSGLDTISGAFYNEGGDLGNEFITIPDPKDGDYQVITKGTDNGEYEVKIKLVSYGNDQKFGAIESESFLKGVAVEGETENKIMNIADGKIIADQEAPVVVIKSPVDGKEYSNNQKVKVDYAVSDNVSAEGNIEKKVELNGVEFVGDEIQLWMMKTGEHSFAVEAQDEAGNMSETEAVFSSSASFRSLANNVGKYYNAKMIKSKKEKTFLTSKLRKLEAIYDFWSWLKKYDGFFWQRKKWDKVARNLEKTMEKETASLIKRLQKEKERDVSPTARDLLIDGLENIAVSF